MRTGPFGVCAAAIDMCGVRMVPPITATIGVPSVILMPDEEMMVMEGASLPGSGNNLGNIGRA